MKKKLLRTKTSKRNAKCTHAYSVSLSRWLGNTAKSLFLFFNTPLRTGDVVYSKTHKLIMTVRHQEGKSVECDWFKNKVHHNNAYFFVD